MMTELAGRLLGRYRVVSQIGAGGMGEVYRARDSKLDRDVAIKVLPDGVSDDADRRQRFEREARVVAQLSHPNILEIHDFGSDEGRFYAVTELLTGQDLRMEMTGRRLRLDRALEIGIAIAEGLGSAHSKGVIHRDIKPSNIFLTQSGQVKILDFGIARLGERSTLNETESSKSTLTAKGTMIGTVGYMAPEQVRGDPADARSDIFSLGCVLYEMFTGKRPFSRETTIATLTAILNKDPSPITTHNPDLPPALDQIVARCLRKEPGRRFESARDVAFSLKALTGVRTSPMRFRRLSSPRLRRQSAAAAVGAAVVVVSLFGWKLVNRWLPGTPVLPIEKHVAVIGFEAPDDSSGVGELAIGLTRTVTSGLSLFERGNLGQFWVVPPHQAEKFGASTVTDYYRKFNVTVAVTGELSRRGELLRLELGVVDAATGRRLRGTVIEDSVSNVASFQEQPVVRIATLLDLPTTSDLQARLASMATTTPEGFQSYLRGIGLLTEPFDGGDLDRAINLLEKAVSIDPLFVAGRVALGRAYLEKFDVTSDLTWLEQADAEAVRAISDEDAAYEAFELLFQVRRRQDRLIDSLEALEHGVRANPQNVDALLKLADEYRNAERFEDSEAQIQNALLLRPGYWPAHDILARLYRTQGRYEAAAVQFREVVNTAPLLTRGYNNLGPVLWFLGRTDEARTLFEQSLAIEPSRSALSNLGTLNFDDRRFADAVDMFKRAIEVDDSRYLTWGNLGYAYRFGPAPERSDACFRKAVELATKRRESKPGNLWILTDIAAYHAMLDEYVQGLELLEQAIAGVPKEPQLIAHIAETFEDLGERDQALVWVARSFEAGVSPRQFDDRPTLRELVADDRYQQLVVDATHYP